jgi:glycosyltransferase involved in cell wall biosynthesis
VILQAGGIAEWSLSYELAQAAREWPDDWVLILHGYGRSEYLDRIQDIAARSNGRILISREMVPYSQLENLIASADIGIALYQNVDQNFFHVASGKVAHYLRCGLPVVAQDFPSLRSLLHDNRCGICVAHPAEVKDAIEHVLLNYEELSHNALRCYVEKLEFGKHFRRVLQKIGELR